MRAVREAIPSVPATCKVNSLPLTSIASPVVCPSAAPRRGRIMIASSRDRIPSSMSITAIVSAVAIARNRPDGSEASAATGSLRINGVKPVPVLLTILVSLSKREESPLPIDAAGKATAPRGVPTTSISTGGVVEPDLTIARCSIRIGRVVPGKGTLKNVTPSASPLKSSAGSTSSELKSAS
jgi:hypothetical protein